MLKKANTCHVTNVRSTFLSTQVVQLVERLTTGRRGFESRTGYIFHSEPYQASKLKGDDDVTMLPMHFHECFKTRILSP